MDAPISELKGVGSKVEELLRRLGITTVAQLVDHIPRRYEDYSKLSSIAAMQPGAVSLRVKITSVTGRYVRRGLHITEAVLEDSGGSVKAVWFNQPYRKNHLRTGVEYFCSGSYEFGSRSYTLMNPSIEKVSDFPKNTARILPIYKETKGLKSHTIRKLLSQIDFDSVEIDSKLPFPHELTKVQAYKLAHFPKDSSDYEKAYNFFAFEELFALMLSAAMVRKQMHNLLAPEIGFLEDVVKGFVASLPFELTPDQRITTWQALKDMQTSDPMNRLVEGDVGSGKTVVATILALNAAKQGKQVAIMVPTSVLAAQHYQSIGDILAGSQLRIGLYTGSLKAKEKEAMRQKLASGEVNIVIGTHALIQDKVEYSSLGLVVIDEQHRFGVNQRNVLVSKSNMIPHVLTMTATPIPRTLALTVFGDLDISIIASMPKGRKPIKTKVVPPNSIKSVYKLVNDEVASGRQAFFIYPLVEESEKLELASATEAHKKLSQVFKDLRVGLIHGRLKPEEKDQIMQDFADGKTHVLVSTTVVEVGVDVPNATVMVIEGAERFGLAQVHQLRGRVGRGEHQAFCILVPTSSNAVSKRLKALETIKDGFKLAEYDLELRGPGAIYGASQHGQLDLRFTKLDNPRQIAAAKQSVVEFMNSGQDLLKYPSLEAAVNRFKSITHLN